MSDNHLMNAIKLVARNCHKTTYLGDMEKDPNYKKLINEAKYRKFTILNLSSPIKTPRGTFDYVEVYAPHPSHKLSTLFLNDYWDNRPQDET